ncbi:sulfatase-like hydrolase/transferase [Paraglaciecola aquimarina]|uniref:Sulfatase-like hydrolase/transferase n=1 Tax=Paraglaciecola aquimarina TaxID=1235557 RepID=A0ABU3T2D7_9ALTE|nr:sulfatase-like hydrolase/transferase [Paraglaciecola aquimarina]MDU0356426.1 sulfatase-like hydrolase/transferase [Paraglaciecola aquimarina]
MKNSIAKLIQLSMTLALVAVPPAQAGGLFNKQKSQPNIVLFFADDMGWSSRTLRDPVYETPNIEQIALDGLEFESAYIPTPTCSPSRATLVTGQHPARIGMPRHIPHKKQYGFDKFGRTTQKYNFWEKDPAQVPSVNWLDTEYVTYAEALKEQGYYNLFVGKWHLGHEGYHPTDQGFDKQIGASNWGHPNSYYPPYFKNSDVYKDVKDRYLTDKLTDDAVEFIQTYDKSKPFMLSMWYYAIHTPFEGRKDLVKHFIDKGLSSKEAHHAALVSGIDESIGRVRKALKDSGMEQNTVVIFLSDQGGLLENKPFRGGKKSTPYTKVVHAFLLLLVGTECDKSGYN